jgi:uncharacterized secreted protein with C-terminal beta-propeller domain
MRKIVFFLLLLSAIIAASAPLLEQARYYSLSFPLKRFSSYEELKSFVEASSQVRPYYRGRTGQTLTFLSAGAWESAPSVPSYSTTNIQVEGVEEADVVKTDGEYIYVVSGKNVVIVKAYRAEEAEVLSQIGLNGTVWGILINGDKLVVFVETTRIFIKVYDVSDRGSPVLKRNFSMDGYYFNSRMIGDYVYAVINREAHRIEDEVALPKIYSGDRVEEIDATEIYYSDVPDYSYMFTTIVAINVQDDEQEPTHETFLLGATHGMYVSLDNIYVTFPELERTLIYRVHIEGSEIESVASGEVPGYVLNQFSMDEHEKHFRIATTTGQVWGGEALSRNNVYVLDMDLNIVGKLEDLGCYLVTFRKVDPLFVIDLENPYAPEVLGFLKVTGYSDYLHPYDENHIIGIGKETEAAKEGNFAWYQGVKISIFDVTNVTKPKEIAKFEIGDRGTDSPVLRDHKAFLFDRSRNLLVIPVLVAEIDEAKYPNGVPPSTHGDYVWQGAYVFNISLDEGLALRGRITHLENDDELMKSGYYFSSPYSVKRSLYIDNVLYTISDKKIKMNNLENLDEVNQVELT